MRRGRPEDERILFLACGFLRDSKIRSLNDPEKVSWLNVLLTHVEEGNGSARIPEHRYGVSRRRLERFLSLGLLDNVEGEFHIHKWDEWNGSHAYKRFLARERKRRQRRRESGGE